MRKQLIAKAVARCPAEQVPQLRSQKELRETEARVQEKRLVWDAEAYAFKAELGPEAQQTGMSYVITIRRTSHVVYLIAHGPWHIEQWRS